ncbi:MAG: hypothetical protein EA401_03080 [Planctomycetota bacterium]|nr:MAG: hypothetical protein EA401_03080 [Planctomycetota bacterium]
MTESHNPDIIWQCQRPPGTRTMVVAIIIALLLIIGGGIIGSMIHLEREPWFGIGVGVLMAVLFIGGTTRGSAVRIDADGILTLSQAGRDNVRIPIADIDGITMVRSAFLDGIGLRLSKLDGVTFCHKSGLSYRSMERLHKRLGIHLILEHLGDEDQQQLRAHLPQPS